MSASFYDLLKYAKTGIASPEMTAYDKMRAMAAAGGGAIKTLTGVPPLSFKADGTPLISWSMKGNGSQSGTPTPDAPIMPEFVGVRTENLFDVADLSGVGWAIQYPDLLEAINSLPNGTYTMSMSFELTSRNDTTDSSACGWYIAKGASILSNIRLSWQNAQIGEIMTIIDTFTINDNNRGAFTALYLYGCGINGVGRTGFATAENIMINDGSTALPYEPFGWAEKITCAGQTTPVYLGQVSTVRRIKKMVLTGEEGWINNSNNSCCVLYITDIGLWTSVNPLIVCSHMNRARAQGDIYVRNLDYGITFGSSLADRICIRNKDCEPVADFKAWLASEYAAGTPVTVWYVLATPETGIVNEPLCKIGDYADELHSEDAGVSIPTAKGQNTLTVDTDLQPSEVSITGKIKEL